MMWLPLLLASYICLGQEPILENYPSLLTFSAWDPISLRTRHLHFSLCLSPFCLSFFFVCVYTSSESIPPSLCLWKICLPSTNLNPLAPTMGSLTRPDQEKFPECLLLVIHIIYCHVQVCVLCEIVNISRMGLGLVYLLSPFSVCSG